MEAKNCAIQAKEAEYLQAEEEKQQLQNQLAQERLSREEEKYELQEQLMNAKAQEQVRNSLVEQELRPFELTENCQKQE